MSTRELAHSMIDKMTEEQLKGFIMLISGTALTTPTAKPLRGSLSKYANPELISQEEGAWERAVQEKYENT